MISALTSALVHFVWQGAALAFLLAVFCAIVRSPRARYAAACAALLAMPAVFVFTAIVMWPAGGPHYMTLGLRPRVGVVTWWMAGAAIVYAYRFVGWMAVQRLRHRAVCAAPAAWQERLRELAARIDLRNRVALLESALVETPIAAGAWRPVILVPLGLLMGFPTEQVDAILLHELAHIARRDYLVNLLQAAVEGLLFYHPAVWWVSHVIRREREFCCDDIVVRATGDATTYARALSTLEQFRSPALAVASTGGSLIARLQRLLGKPASRFATALPAFAFLLLGTAAALLAFQPPPAPKPKPTPVPAPAASPKTEPPVTPEPPVRVQVESRMQEAGPRKSNDAPYQKWINEEVHWIATEPERTAFLRLQTDDERQMFIQYFWIRRNPRPDAADNDYQAEYYRRLAFANEHFGDAENPGWMTERGRAYVQYGVVVDDDAAAAAYPDARLENSTPRESGNVFDRINQAYQLRVPRGERFLHEPFDLLLPRRVPVELQRGPVGPQLR